MSQTEERLVAMAAASLRSRFTDKHVPVDSALVGAQWEWGWGLPGTLRAFSAPGGDAAIPALPQPDDPHAQSLGYWGALHYILLQRLGWERVHLGLHRWFESGKTSDDVTLRIIDLVWGRDNGLDVYARWVFRTQRRYDIRSGFPILGPDADPIDRDIRRTSDQLASRADESRFPWFTVNDGDALHLGGHLFPAPGPTPNARLIKVAPAKQRAILLSPDMRWYRALLDRDAELPVVGSHSWKVEVHVDSVGLIGTFRKSAVTGLWFTGKHSTHMMGNA